MLHYGVDGLQSWVYCDPYFLHGATAPSGSGSHFRGFTITLGHMTLGWTPLDE